MSEVSISSANKKMGKISSVSLPSVVTCRKCACQQKCYARKLERLRPAVAAAYKRNLDVLQSDPDTYWREVEAAFDPDGRCRAEKPALPNLMLHKEV